jgi:hypothetical protein
MTTSPPPTMSSDHIAGWSLLADLDRRRGEIARRLTNGPGGQVSLFAFLIRLRTGRGGDRWAADVPEGSVHAARQTAEAADLPVDPYQSPGDWPGWVQLSGPLPSLWRSCGCVACSHPGLILNDLTHCHCQPHGCWCAAEGHQSPGRRRAPGSEEAS